MTSTLKPWLGFGLLMTALGLGGCAIAQAQRTTPPATPTLSEAASNTAIAPTSDNQATTAQGEAPSQAQQIARASAASQREAEALFSQAPLGRPNRPISAANITTVKVFNLDSQCDGFEGEIVKLNEDGSLEEAVGLAIANSNNPDFSIASYRVGDGRFTQEVVVDLRLASDSKRVFSSLSICESQALFGSIRRTLIENGQFDVTQVQFTASGEAIIL